MENVVRTRFLPVSGPGRSHDEIYRVEKYLGYETRTVQLRCDDQGLLPQPTQQNVTTSRLPGLR